MVVLGSAVIGLVVDQMAKGIEEEASRYKASYSAKKMDTIYVRGQNSRKNILTIIRYQGDELMTERQADPTYPNRELPKKKLSCAEIDKKPNETKKTLKSVELEIEIKRDGARKAYQLKPKKITLKRTKAKVKAFRWLVPWSWWMALDKSEGVIELNAKVVLTALIKDKDKIKTVDLIAADLPLGKFNLDKDIIEVEIDDVVSDWFFIPDYDSKDTDFGNRPFIARVTLEESDDFGDILGKVAKGVSDRKKDIINVIIDSGGINGGTAVGK
ncbi:MAG: hypothetical protein NPIRA05_08360 [Nitrospirales bacterium]|nr:MAG: hypothetical protein NPIRA05_08360 [Nitrospirales bacterium]